MNQTSAINPNYDGIQLQLVVHAGPLAGKGFPISGETVTFGRDDENDITLDDDEVSRYHARLSVVDKTITIEDLGSTNGTEVNGKKIEGQHVLQPTDIIGIGSSIFGVKGFSAPATVGYSEPKTSSEPANVPPPPSSPSKPRPSRKKQTTNNGLFAGTSLLLLGAGTAFFIVILVVIAGFMYILSQGSTKAVASIPKVIITTPVTNTQIELNQPVTVQATASDPNGIVRAELWVDGTKQDEEVSPAPEGQATLAVSFQWTPQTLGSHTIEVKAYNSQGSVSTPTIVTVQVGSQEASTNTPEITATPTPVLETATPIPGKPSLIALTDLNVQAGPGVEYDLLGLLPARSEAEIVGKDVTLQWWQIRFAPAPNGFGWVTTNPNFSEPLNIQNVPIVVAPPTPTSTPTATPNLPTFTPVPASTATNTPIPPTDTPTPTPTQEATSIQFEVQPRQIEAGKCVDMTWNVTGVKAVYIQDIGVSGSGKERLCPEETTHYVLRAVKLDDTEENIEIIVEVTGDTVYSAGDTRLSPNSVFDLDEGLKRESGADFRWFIEDSTRRFEALDGVDMAPLGTKGSIQDVSQDDCAKADYNKYSYIDASDDASNPDNILVSGRIVCYITNDGRAGKLRLPDYNTGDLAIEWVTWE